MSLRIIKQGSGKTAAIHPLFLTEERRERRPEPFVLPEARRDGKAPGPSETFRETPSVPVVDIEQLKKDAFDRGYAEGLQKGLQEGSQKGLQEGLQKGKEDGLREGLKAGGENAAARIEEMTRHYTDTLAEVAAFKDTLRAQVEKEVVRLSLAVAKKIVHREIHIDPTIIHTLVRVALERVSGKSVVTVRLSPPDYEYMTSKHAGMAAEEGREIKFESDSAIAQGDCVINTETGDIDARIEEEFKEVESSFFEGA